MAWIKRNLFFAIGGVIALGLLGAAGFYFYSSWQRNNQAFAKLSEIYNTLKQVSAQKPAPGKNGENIQMANQQAAQLRKWIQQAQKYFQPIPPVPAITNGVINSKEFADALPRTLDLLQREAAAANVDVPPGYDFSFQAQSGAVRFAPGSLGPLAQQLGEIKVISEVLFSAGVNGLESIQRVRVSDDDIQGPQNDYISAQPVTNDLAVITPYQVTFRSFTPEIAGVLRAFATSPNGFIVRTVAVQPASASGFGTAGAGGTPYGPPGYDNPGYGERPGGPMGMPPAAPGLATPAPMGRAGLQTVLNEQLLRITMEVDIVKLTPRN